MRLTDRSRPFSTPACPRRPDLPPGRRCGTMSPYRADRTRQGVEWWARSTTSCTEAPVDDREIQRVRDTLLFEGPERGRRTSRFFMLLVLAAAISTYGLLADSVATVIGAMIVAPLMLPIMGLAFGVSLGDRRAILRSLVISILGIGAAIAVGWLLTRGFSSVVDPESNSQIMSRTSPQADRPSRGAGHRVRRRLRDGPQGRLGHPARRGDSDLTRSPAGQCRHPAGHRAPRPCPGEPAAVRHQLSRDPADRRADVRDHGLPRCLPCGAVAPRQGDCDRRRFGAGTRHRRPAGGHESAVHRDQFRPAPVERTPPRCGSKAATTGSLRSRSPTDGCASSSPVRASFPPQQTAAGRAARAGLRHAGHSRGRARKRAPASRRRCRAASRRLGSPLRPPLRRPSGRRSLRRASPG